MARLTNEHLHSEIKLVKNDVEHLRDGQEKMQDDLTMIKKVLLNPDDGTIARVNKNTVFRKSTGKVLWSLWIAMVGVIAKLIFWN
jgi:hypothetical protein|tara:strand:+ start:878 stop:1132 length:255 start_codon:yes stop_codon:yes gene_type:complete